MNASPKTTELELMKKLGIESWRNLSKDKFMGFVSDLPNLDKDVALKIIGQFPNFKDLVLDGFQELKEDAGQARKFAWKGQKSVHKAHSQYREVLDRELEKDDLTVEDRFAILDRLERMIEHESEKDLENKKFQFALNGVVKVGTVAMVALAAVVLGGKGHLGRG